MTTIPRRCVLAPLIIAAAGILLSIVAISLPVRSRPAGEIILRATLAWESGVVCEPALFLDPATGKPAMLYTAGWDAEVLGRMDNPSGDLRTWIKHDRPLLGHGFGGWPGDVCHGAIAGPVDGLWYYLFSGAVTTGDFCLATSKDTWNWTVESARVRTAAGLGGTNAGNAFMLRDGEMWRVFLEVYIGGRWVVLGFEGADLHALAPTNGGQPLTSLAPNGADTYGGLWVARRADGQYEAWYHCAARGVLPTYITSATSPDCIHWTPARAPRITFTANQHLPHQDQVADPEWLAFGRRRILAFSAMSNSTPAGCIIIRQSEEAQPFSARRSKSPSAARGPGDRLAGTIPPAAGWASHSLRGDRASNSASAPPVFSITRGHERTAHA